jgi:hypothetical protein
MNLKIEDQNEIELPDWIGGTSLTLSEIGAIACMGCIRNGSEVPEVMERLEKQEMVEALASLQAKGVLSLELTDNKLSVEIDLDAVLPSSLKNS